MNQILPCFACPNCKGELLQRPQSWTNAAVAPQLLYCPVDDREYAFAGDIWRFLDSSGNEEFAQHYRRVRRREGWGRGSSNNLRRLPEVGAHDPHQEIWRLRAASFRHLQRFLTANPASVIVDLGAGNSWLAHRLADAGWTVVAVDRDDDEVDGLGARTAYADPEFVSVQADCDELPLARASADVAVFNGSLHYSADLAATLGEAARVLRTPGRIVIMDSPFYGSEAAGGDMLAEREAQWTAAGLSSPGSSVGAPLGFLTKRQVRQTAISLGLEPQFERVHRGLRARLAPLRARLKGRREPATFPFVVCTKKALAESA